MATVLIIGASRGVGLETVKAALKAGHSVRALARSARRIRVDHPKLEKMAGDALEMATVKSRADRSRCYHPVARCFGRARNHPQADAAFFQSDTSARHRDGGGSSQLDLRDGLRDRRQLGSGGFLCSAAFHLLLGRVYDDKDLQERIIRRSKLDWVIVRPVILTDGPKTNAYRALVDPRRWTCGLVLARRRGGFPR